MQTCARCFQVPQHCPGKGVAKKCEVQGGPKVLFIDHILDMWKRIGYSPDNATLSEIASHDSEEAGELQQQDGGDFTPGKRPVPATERFTGVQIKQFPRDIDHGEIVEFLVASGLPEKKKENITIMNNGTAIIKDLENGVCVALIQAIHGKKKFDKKLYCNGFIPLTPEKPEISAARSQSLTEIMQDVQAVGAHSEHTQEGELRADSGLPHTGQTVDIGDGGRVAAGAEGWQSLPDQKGDSGVEGREVALNGGHPLPGQVAGRVLSGHGQAEGSETPNLTFTDSFRSKLLDSCAPGSTTNSRRASFTSTWDLVGRHSKSLYNRTPEPNSLAADLLAAPSLKSAKSALLKDIADLTESLSDFNSCVESATDVSSSSDDGDTPAKPENKEFKSMNERKRCKKAKRKLLVTPDKEEFVKKLNNQKSPQ